MAEVYGLRLQAVLLDVLECHKLSSLTLVGDKGHGKCACKSQWDENRFRAMSEMPSYKG